MLNRIKYWLLIHLLRDLCKGKNCRDCRADIKGHLLCCRSYVVMMAQEVWKIGGADNG